jgi:hypothetical protein
MKLLHSKWQKVDCPVSGERVYWVAASAATFWSLSARALESLCELDSGSCSARLQAGICLIPDCPPEGGRYKNAAILSFHTDFLAHDGSPPTDFFQFAR